MKIIDRHLLRTLATPLVYCLLAFTMVFVVIDLFEHLSHFLAAGTPLSAVAGFYLGLVPSGLVYIVPVSLLLAVLYSLSTLTRHNELTAMRACGVSLYRLMFPFLAAGIAIALVVALAHERIAPQSAFDSRQFVRAQRADDPRSVYVTRNLPLRNEAERRTWLIGAFDTRTFEMKGIEVVQHRADGLDAYRLTAAEGRWADGRWWFREVVRQPYDERGDPRGAPERWAIREMAAYSETPKDFLGEVKDPEFMSAAELRRYLGREGLGEAVIRRLRVDLHHRFAAPWMCLVVTLIGIPLGHQTGRRGALRGAMLALAAFFGFYILVPFALWLGKAGVVPPWLAGWGPNLVFGGLGAALIARMR